MPALKNPRHEAFAQAILQGLSDPDTRHSNGRAYNTAGYLAKPGASADSAASSRLRKFKCIIDRVRELQADANKRLEPKLDISRETIGRRLRRASTMAEEDRNPAAMATCELGMARVFHSIQDTDQQRIDFNSAQSMQDIGRKLLQSIGFASPDDASVQEAVQLNDAFVDGLQAIHQRAQALTLDDGGHSADTH